LALVALESPRQAQTLAVILFLVLSQQLEAAVVVVVLTAL
jgi:hypothetical protein